MAKTLSVHTGLIDGDNLFVVDIDTWLFVEFDLADNNCKCIADIKPIGYEGLCWVQRIIRIGDEYYFILRNTRQLISVNNRGEVCYYRKESVFEKNDCFLYMDGFVLDDILYILPGNSKGVISKFDLKRKVFLDDIPLSKLSNDQLMSETHQILKYIKRADGQYLFCIKNTNCLCILNIFEMSLDIVKISTDGAYHMIQGESGRLFLLDNNKYRITELDGEFTPKRVYENNRIDECDDWTGYKFCFYVDDTLYAIPASMDQIDVFGLFDERPRVMMLPDESKCIKSLRNFKGKATELLINDNKAYLLPFSSNGLVLINTGDTTAIFYPLYIRDRDISLALLGRGDLVNENDEYKLFDYVKNLLEY